MSNVQWLLAKNEKKNHRISFSKYFITQFILEHNQIISAYSAELLNIYALFSVTWCE